MFCVIAQNLDRFVVRPISASLQVSTDYVFIRFVSLGSDQNGGRNGTSEIEGYHSVLTVKLCQPVRCLRKFACACACACAYAEEDVFSRQKCVCVCKVCEVHYIRLSIAGYVW